MIDHMMGGIEDIAGNVGHNRIREQLVFTYGGHVRRAMAVT